MKQPEFLAIGAFVPLPPINGHLILASLVFQMATRGRSVIDVPGFFYNMIRF